MSLTNAAETALLTLIFNNTNWANIGDATGLRGSTTAGSFYLSLHTADPGEAGSQTTSEAGYTGYGRVAVPRSAGGWTITGNSCSPTAAINFGACTAGTGTATHMGLGTDVSGAGNLIMKGSITPTIAYAPGVTPQLNTSTVITLD